MPSQAALKDRAKALVHAMNARSRWIYALPRAFGIGALKALLIGHGFRADEEDTQAGVYRLVSDSSQALFVLFDSADLEALIIEAEGAGAAPVLAKVLEKTGFYAQSQLLEMALRLNHPEALKALRTLAHMVIAWDEDWSDLFLLHLASPDPVVRHEAAACLSLAAMVAREAGPSLELLEEARRREAFPKLRETLGEAIQMVKAATGAPVEIGADGMPKALS